ncbi:MAG: branched-chain amino acid transporter permease [Glaciihabitans sp.]|nr:branched-chain amino acid transporter permease [Glaciihabitans sp.]
MKVDQFIVIMVSLLSSVSLLVIVSLGLALAFGMMGVINMAHGEFLMLGAYFTITAVNAGIVLPVAILISAIAMGGLGMVIERIVLRQLYGRIWATMLATWGLSLLIVGVVQLVFGTSSNGIPTPLSTIHLGGYMLSQYSLVLIALAGVLIATTYLVFARTPYGTMARAAASLPEMAAAVGINVSRVNMITFGIASALAGLGGGLLAPLSGVSPTFGQGYIGDAFMTVVVGGASPLLGASTASLLLGGIYAGVSNIVSPVAGTLALLLVSMLVLRFLPTGLTGLWRKARQ